MKPFDQYEIDWDVNHGTWDINHGTWDVNHGTWDIYESIKSNTMIKEKLTKSDTRLKDTPPPTLTK